MALTDYFMVDMTILAVMSVLFFILGVTEDQFPRNIIFDVISLACCFSESLMIIAATDPFSIVLSFAFSFMGITSLLLTTIIGVKTLNYKHQEKWKV